MKHERKILVNIVILVIALCMAGVGWADPPGWKIKQITDNSEDDDKPQISGTNVVWQGNDGSDREIYLYDVSTITQVTDNSEDEGHAD